MRKFEVGDKVRLARNTLFDWHMTGEEGVIVGFDDPDEGEHFIEVRFDNPDRDGDRECYISVAMITPRIDPTIITRLNEVVTMLVREKRRAAKRIAYRKGLLNRNTNERHVGYYEEGVIDATFAHNNIVARIEAVTKVIEELTKEER